MEEKSTLNNPFVGLRPYESHEAPVFFGRDEFTKELLKRLQRTRFVAVVGSSGSGKSSLIRAGLIPELMAGFLAQERDRWKIITLKPGDQPLRSLAESIIAVTGPVADKTLANALDDIERTGLDAVTRRLYPMLEDGPSNLLVLVDQFEELFTHRPTGQSEKSEHHDQVIDFISIMLGLAKFENLPIYVVLTMRSDYIGECDAYSGLAEAINRSQYLVPRLGRSQRKAVIQGPIRLFGEDISEDLVGTILSDIRDDKDQLPVLQYALMRTWSCWKAEGGESPIKFDSYDRAGKITGAIKKDAEDAYEAAKAEGLADLTKRLFQALTGLDANNRAVRRPLRLDELQAIIEGERDQIDRVIELFRGGGRSFLMLPEDRNPLIDISHESLIRQWSQLNAWVEEEAVAAESYRSLERAAKNWERTGSKDDLLTGYDLEQALNWQKQGYFRSAWATRYETVFVPAIRCLEESKDAFSRKKVAEEEAAQKEKQLEIDRIGRKAEVKLQKERAERAKQETELIRARAEKAEQEGELAKQRLKFETQRAQLAKQRAMKIKYALATCILSILVIAAFSWFGMMYKNRLKDAIDHLSKGRFDKAIIQCENALFWDDDHPDVYITQGIAFVQIRKHREAIEVFSKGIENASNSSRLHLHMGHTYLKLDMEKEAVQRFKRVLELSRFDIDERGLKVVVNALLKSKNIKDIQEAIYLAPYMVGGAFYEKVINASEKEGDKSKANKYKKLKEKILRDKEKALKIDPEKTD